METPQYIFFHIFDFLMPSLYNNSSEFAVNKASYHI